MKILLDALTRYNIPAPRKPVTEAQFTRWGHNARYWARKIGDGYIFGDYATDLSESIFPRNERLSPAELQRLKRQLQRQRRIETQAQLSIYEQAQERAIKIWKYASGRDIEQHTYLKKKGVGAYNIRWWRSFLLLPLYDETGKIWSLQFIDRTGNKRFLKNGRKKGCFLSIGGTPKNNRVVICEGYATGASIHESTGDFVIICFDAGNIKNVARNLRRIYREETFIYAADNDIHADGQPNKGVVSANIACAYYGGRVVIPQMDGNKCDFNDIYVQHGAETVRQYFNDDEVTQ